MDFLKTIAEIISSLTVIIGALITIEKFTKGKLTQWIVKPVVEPINNRIDVLEEKSNKRGKNVTTLKQEVEKFRKDSKEDMAKHILEYDKTYLTDFLSDLEKGTEKTEIQKKRAYEIFEEYTKKRWKFLYPCKMGRTKRKKFIIDRRNKKWIMLRKRK